MTSITEDTARSEYVAGLRALLAVCICTPCVTPGNGGPTPGHCAACCGLTGIEEYDPGCPVEGHREMAFRQFGEQRDSTTEYVGKHRSAETQSWSTPIHRARHLAEATR